MYRLKRSAAKTEPWGRSLFSFFTLLVEIPIMTWKVCENFVNKGAILCAGDIAHKLCKSIVSYAADTFIKITEFFASASIGVVNANSWSVLLR